MIQFQKQPVMRQVVYSLIPAIVAGIFFYGWYTLVVWLTSMITCTITEWLFVRSKKTAKVSEAVWVTATLFAMTLPPSIPLWIVTVGCIFAVIFAKMAFGGFGFNIFNPALAGRAFIYIAFPTQMTAHWTSAADFTQFPAGLAAWRYQFDALTSATPLSIFRDGLSIQLPYYKLLFGNINGTVVKLGETLPIGGGCIGETSALLLILGGGWLLFKKISNWRIVLSFFTSFLVMQPIFHALFPLKTPDLLYGLLSGGIILGAFYMLTDPVSAAKTDSGQWIYGFLVAFFTIIIRSFSLFPEGMMFAILLGNMFNPIIDLIFKKA